MAEQPRFIQVDLERLTTAIGDAMYGSEWIDLAEDEINAVEKLARDAFMLLAADAVLGADHG